MHACVVISAPTNHFSPLLVCDTVVIQAATIAQNAKDLQATIATKVADKVYTDGVKVGGTEWCARHAGYT